MCEHNWVSVGTRKYCTKCGANYGIKKEEKPVEEKPVEKKPRKTTKKVSTAKAE